MKKSVYILILIIILILTVVLVLVSNSRHDATDDYQERVPVVSNGEKTSVTVYYLSGDERFLLPISFDITSTNEAAKVAMEKLLAGPPTEEAMDPVPNDTKLLNLYSIGDTVYVDLTFDFLLLSADDISRAVDAITATVLPLTSCQKLRFLVEGEEAETTFGPGSRSLAETFNSPYLNLIGEDTDLVYEPGFDPTAYLSIICYLPDSSGEYLIPITTLLPLAEAGADIVQARAEAAVKMLLTMPATEGLLTLSMSGLELQDLQISEQVAYCDFNTALLNTYGEWTEKLFLSCLVRTLVSQKGIDAVQLTVNGESVQQTASGQDITQPLMPDSPINSFN
jgi:germination protein M